MLVFKGSAELCRIVVLNPKGGSGKTTLAFNLAGYLANNGRKVALIDMDRQGSSTHWLHNRSSELPAIFGVSVTGLDVDATENQCIDVPEEIEYAVIDAPAGLSGGSFSSSRAESSVCFAFSGLDILALPKITIVE